MSHLIAMLRRGQSKSFARALAAVAVAIGPGFGAFAADPAAHLPSLVEQTRPKREAELIAIHQDARSQLAAATTIDKRKSTRLAMQIRVQDLLLPDTSMVNWTGVLRDIAKTKDGDVAFKVEIAPDIMIVTPPNRLDDPQHVSLVAAGTPLAKALQRLHPGDPVVFSGQIKLILATDDEDMVERPMMSAHFDSVKRLAAAGNDGSH